MQSLFPFFVASGHRVTEKATSGTTTVNNKFPFSPCSVDIESVLHDASLRTLKR